MPKFSLRIIYSLSLILCFSGSSPHYILRADSRPLSPGATHLLNRSSYQYYLGQRLKADLSSLVQLGREITKQAQPDSGRGNYKQVSQRADKIRKLARRIKSALTMGSGSEKNQANKTMESPIPASPSPESLRREILEINPLVYKIRRNYARLGRHVINAKLQCELYETVETLESLALHVKVCAEGLSELN